MGSFELVLFAGLILLACVNAATMAWAFYLDHRLRQRPVPKHYEVHVEGEKVLKEVDLNQVEEEAVNELHGILNEAAEQLRTTLTSMTTAAASNVEQRIKEAADAEFASYKESLGKNLAANEETLAKLNEEVEQKRANLYQMLADAVQKEYAGKLEVFETRLNDVVSGYILDSLGTNADMSAQIEAIIESLEKHKDELKQDLVG